MKKVALVIFLVFCYSLHATKKAELDSILFVLDQTIANKDLYVKQKEKRIEDLKQTLTFTDFTLEQKYDINSRLYNEYKSFMPDSAILFVQENLQISGELNHKDKLYESTINLALLYAVAGMYIDSDKLLNSIDPKELSGWAKRMYYDSYKQLFYFYPPNVNSRKNYKIYRDSLLTVIEPESNDYRIVYSEKLTEQGEYEKARQLLIPMFNDSEDENHWRAVLAYAIGETYRGEDNFEMQKKYYAISAISDIQNSIKENASMRALAIAFYETNDIEHAYKYVQQSMEDAVFSNARLRTMEVSQVFPIIEKSYQLKIQSQKNKLLYLVICIGVLSFFLIIAVLYVYRQLKKLSRARRSLSDVNKQLYNLNDDLQASNQKMTEVNKELSEANLLKETYISQFLEICSMYINKLQQYQKSLNKKAMERKLDELYKMLKSNDMIDKEIKELYTIFDNVFLHLYPSFVDDFNTLLNTDEQFILKPNELLNAELRIFALIRLGITDSAKIAGFLHYSPTTIYNYRTRVRNKSAVPREDFENYVMKIGVISK